MNISNRNKISESMNKLLAEVKGKGEENMIETLAMRSMSKAVYSTENIGHYGLAFEYYSHFTSLFVVIRMLWHTDFCSIIWMEGNLQMWLNMKRNASTVVRWNVWQQMQKEIPLNSCRLNLWKTRRRNFQRSNFWRYRLGNLCRNS